MSVRERMLAVVVLGFIVLAGVVLMIQQFIWRPLRDRDTRIATLNGEIQDKQAKISLIQAQKPKFEVWRQLSLPADLNFARLEYEKHLREMLRQSGFDASSTTVTPRPGDAKTSPTLPGKKEPIFTPLTFVVLAHGELVDLVDFLERFYRTPLMHEIKKLDIRRPLTALPNFGAEQRTNILDVEMTVEALVLGSADKRNQLLPAVDWRLAGVDVLIGLCNGPGGLLLTPWAVGPTGPVGPRILASPTRQYASIAGKDIFFGPKAPEQVAEKIEATEFIYLTDITHVGDKAEAFLYDRYNNSKTRLRPTAGFDSFRIRDSKGETLVQGKVIRIDDRDLIFRCGEKYYSIHVGENLLEALKHPLDTSQLKELGLNGGASNGNGK
jgi:hypothetical protein